MTADLQLPTVTDAGELARRMSDLTDEAAARHLLVTGAATLFGCAAAGYGHASGSGGRAVPNRPAVSASGTVSASNTGSGSSTGSGDSTAAPSRLEFTFGGAQPAADGLTEATRAVPEALALTALHQGEPVISPDLATETRWPAYAAAMTRWTGVRSVLAQPVRLTGATLGVLAFYATEPAFFGAEDATRAEQLAGQAALALGLLAGRAKTRNLTTALETSREIGQAMGILMGTRKITSDRAFELLKDVSQRAHVKLREVAREVILTGQLPG